MFAKRKQIAELLKRDGVFLVDVYAAIKRTIQISPLLSQSGMFLLITKRRKKICFVYLKIEFQKNPSRANTTPLCVCSKQVGFVCLFVEPFFQSLISHFITGRTPPPKIKMFPSIVTDAKRCNEQILNKKDTNEPGVFFLSDAFG